jgi:hypothetical protein
MEIVELESERAHGLEQIADPIGRRSCEERVDVTSPPCELRELRVAARIAIRDIIDCAAESIDFEHCNALSAGSSRIAK